MRKSIIINAPRSLNRRYQTQSNSSSEANQHFNPQATYQGDLIIRLQSQINYWKLRHRQSQGQIVHLQKLVAHLKSPLPTTDYFNPEIKRYHDQVLRQVESFQETARRAGTKSCQKLGLSYLSALHKVTQREEKNQLKLSNMSSGLELIGIKAELEACRCKLVCHEEINTQLREENKALKARNREVCDDNERLMLRMKQNLEAKHSIAN